MADQDTPPPTITAMKIPIIKKGEYDIWSMRMRQYICHTDHNLWDIIVNGDLEDEATPSGEQSSPPVPKTAKQLAIRRNQEKIKSILLLAIPDEYLLQFHNVPDAKSLWAAIKSRFGALIMRKKPDIDEIDIDDLYNYLRVYEDEMKKSSTSSFNTQNLAFISSENSSSTNTVSGEHRVSAAARTAFTSQVSSTPCTHDVSCSFFAHPTTSPQLENEDFQQIDGDDLEELDLRWQVAMLTVRVKKFIQRTGRNMDFKEKRHVSLDMSKIECFNCHRKGHFARECRSARSQGRRPYGDRSNAQTTESSSQALVAQDGLGGYDWSNDFEVEPVNYALMAISSSSSSSSSDSEINNLNTELEKVVKEIDELKLKIEKWEGSSKNLTKILNSQMSAHDKNELGFGTQIDELSNKSETDSENSMTVLKVRSSDEDNTLGNSMFTKATEYHVVSPPITRNLLTSRADISFVGLDEYAIRNKIIESKTTETSKTVGTTNEATIVKPKSVNETVVSKSKINRDEVIIEDWTSDDEEDMCLVNTVSSVKPNVTQAVRSQADKSGQTSQKQGIHFKKKYPHAKRTFNPSAVLTRAGLVNTDRSNVSTARSISTVRPVRPVSTARPLASKIAQSNSVIRPKHPRLDIVRPKASNTPIKRSYFTQPVYRPKDLKPDVKTFGVKNMTTVGTRAVVSKGKVENVLKQDKWVWRPKMNYQDHVYKYNGSYMLKKFEYGNPEILLQDHAVVDSSCSSHMTGNKAYLSDHEDLNGGFMAFGSDPKGDELNVAINGFDMPLPVAVCSGLVNPLAPRKGIIISPTYNLLLSYLTPYRICAKRGFRGAPRPLLPAMLLVATTNPSACQEHPDMAQSQPSSSTIPVPSTSSPTRLVTPSKTIVNASGEEQVEYISPNTLVAVNTLSRVASQKPKSIDKGMRYKRRKETKGKKVVTSMDFQEKVSTSYATGVNTGIIKSYTVIGKVSTVSRQLVQDSIKKSIIPPDKSQREGKAPMIIEEAPKKTKEQIHRRKARLARSYQLDTLEKRREAKQRFQECARKWHTRRRLCKEARTWKLSQLKNLSFEEVKEEFDKLVKQGESKDSKDADPISGTNIPINPVPVAIKPPSIATYKIIKQGEKDAKLDTKLHGGTHQLQDYATNLSKEWRAASWYYGITQ
ncbi:ribonuclease H-like domain-containing protein [Tanacetum coccineum]